MNVKDFIKKVDKEGYIIPIERFVSNYLFEDKITNFRGITHKDLKGISSPLILRISYEMAYNNYDLVKKGHILIVKDRCGQVISYLNPLELMKISSLNEIDNEIEKLKKEKIYQTKQILLQWQKLEKLIAKKNEIQSTIYLLNIFKKRQYIDILKGEIDYDKHKRKQRVKYSKS